MIDPNEAPDGFVAVATPSHGWACKQCCLYSEDAICIKSPCRGSVRKDGESVIFIPREKSNLAEFSAIGELAEARAMIKELEGINHGITFQNDGLKRKIAAQRERIRQLEGATNHATGTPLSKAKDEAARWKSSHDHVCRKFADCENARDENARLCEEAREELKRWQDLAAKYSKEREHNANEALRWQAECRDRDGLIAKLKAQLTAALESIARTR